MSYFCHVTLKDTVTDDVILITSTVHLLSYNPVFVVNNGIIITVIFDLRQVAMTFKGLKHVLITFLSLSFARNKKTKNQKMFR